MPFTWCGRSTWIGAGCVLLIAVIIALNDTADQAVKAALHLLPHHAWKGGSALQKSEEKCYDHNVLFAADLRPGYQVDGGTCTYELIERIHDIGLKDYIGSDSDKPVAANDPNDHGYPLLEWESGSLHADEHELVPMQGRLWPIKYDQSSYTSRELTLFGTDGVLSQDTDKTRMIAGPQRDLLPMADKKGREYAAEHREGSLDDKEGIPSVHYKRSTKYSIHERFARGAYGEIWRASDGKADFVLKRMFVEKGPQVRRSGLREVHFGQLLKGAPRIARFVEYFSIDKTVSSTDSRHNTQEPAPHSTQTEQVATALAKSGHHRDERDNKKTGPLFDEAFKYERLLRENETSELWLVFHDEGTSLHGLLYNVVTDEQGARLERSQFWRELKTPPGLNIVKSITRQLLEALADCHRRGVTHRDVKPQNILIRLQASGEIDLRLADFGSGVDSFSARHLYGSEGPTKDDNTMEYAPPEVLFGDIPFFPEKPESYDMWSLGILIMELTLGTAHVFQVDSRLRAYIDQQLSDRPTGVRRAAHMYQAMQQFCLHDVEFDHLDQVYIRTPSGPLGKKLRIRECNEASFAQALTRLDPLRLGYPSKTGVDLLKRLLSWDPLKRISAHKALDHAYFTNTATDGEEPFRCGCGKVYMFLNEYRIHTKQCSGSRT